MVNHVLSLHPDIFMCPHKETSFMAYAGTPPIFGGPVEDAKWFSNHIITDPDRYRSLFSGVRSERAVGESSVVYLYSPAAISNIKRYSPGARLLVILRNPIERAFSAYSYFRKKGYETCTFPEALDLEPERIREGWRQMWHYQNSGYYSRYLAAYLAAFGAERVRIILYDDLLSDQAASFRDLFAFLGVDPAVEVEGVERLNSSGSTGVVWLDRFIMNPSGAKRIARSLMPRGVFVRAKALFFRVGDTRDELDAETHDRLRRSFEPEIRALQQLTGLDLHHWISASSASSLRPVSSE